MAILLTNDDGLEAELLFALWERLSPLQEVLVVVPEGEKSASSHSLTLHRPLVVKEVKWKDNLSLFALQGTPADCVLFAKRGLSADIQLVVSGINKGPNLGWDIFYSGTVGAAMEGAMHGITSFSISLDDRGDRFFWETALTVAERLAKILLTHPLPPLIFLNVNVPNLPLERVKGVALTRLGKRMYPSPLRQIYQEGDKRVFWVGGEEPLDEGGEGTDVYELSQGKITITPLGWDLTAYEALSMLKEWRWDLL